MKKVFIAKHGAGGIFVEVMIFLPCSLIVSFVSAAAFDHFFDIYITVPFCIAFVIINLIWVIRNSFVLLEKDRLKFKDIFGKTHVIDCQKLLHMNVLSACEFRKTVKNLTRENPVLTNCISILFSVKNVILFETGHGRNIMIGVYKPAKLKNALEKFSLPEKEDTLPAAACAQGGAANERYFIKMPFKYHIICYFKNCIGTIICPVIVSAVLSFAVCKLISSVKYFLIFFAIFLIHSAFYYLFDVMLIVNNQAAGAMKVNCCVNKQPQVILYKHIKNVRCISSPAEYRQILENNAEMIKTPQPDGIWQNVICIELDNGATALLSVYNHERLYHSLSCLPPKTQ